MKQKALALVISGIALASLAPSHLVMASDHLDSPSVLTNPSTDITDLYAWKNGAKTYLVMSVFPLADANAKFSVSAQYVFHTASAAQFGGTSTPLDLMCTFDAAQAASCWAGSEYVHGDASSAAGLSSASGKFRVFAGLRGDPAFFNLTGFKDMAATIEAAASSLTFNAAGCPSVGAATSSALVSELSHTSGGSAVNFFAGKNVLAIVLEVETAILISGGPILNVWGSTNS